MWLLLSRHTQRGASATHGKEGKDDFLTARPPANLPSPPPLTTSPHHLPSPPPLATSPRDLASISQVHLFKARGGHRVYYLETCWMQATPRTTSRDLARSRAPLTATSPPARPISRDLAWQGVYSNTPHCLVKFELEAGTHHLTLALAQYQPVDHQVRPRPPAHSI